MTILPYSSQFHSNCMEIFNSNCPKYFSEAERADFMNWLTQEVDETHPYWVGLMDQQVVACAGIYCADDQFGRAEFSNEVGFAWGMVHADFHKQGFGTQFAEFRIDYLKKHYIDRPIILRTTQKTYLFFEQHDFVVRSWQKNGYGDGLDKVVMHYQSNSPQE